MKEGEGTGGGREQAGRWIGRESLRLGEKWQGPHTPVMLPAGCRCGFPADCAAPTPSISVWHGGLSSTPLWLPWQGGSPSGDLRFLREVGFGLFAQNAAERLCGTGQRGKPGTTLGLVERQTLAAASLAASGGLGYVVALTHLPPALGR